MSLPRHLGLGGFCFRAAKATGVPLVDAHQLAERMIALTTLHANAGNRIRYPIYSRPRPRPRARLCAPKKGINIAKILHSNRRGLRVIDNKLKLGGGGRGGGAARFNLPLNRHAAGEAKRAPMDLD